jgi:uncharacterized phiE125 gp8 family phage protein
MYHDLDRRPVPTFVLKTPPVIEPIGLDEVKAHSRIDLDNDDLLIQDKIIAVRTMYEIILNLAIITQTWTMYLECLPMDCIEIFRIPVQSITSVKYIDAAGATQTLASNLYYTDLNARPPRLVRTQSASWPYVQPRPSAVAVEFVAGFGDKRENVPADLRTYLLYKIGDFYENRETYSELKFQKFDYVDSIKENYRLFSL